MLRYPSEFLVVIPKVRNAWLDPMLSSVGHLLLRLTPLRSSWRRETSANHCRLFWRSSVYGPPQVGEAVGVLEGGYPNVGKGGLEGLSRTGLEASNIIDILIQVKFLHRVYYTPARLHRIFPEHDPVCPRCKTQLGSYLHVFWECPIIFAYWEAINLRLKLTLIPAPSLALLGLPDDEQHSHHLKLLISYLLYYAKKEILIKWLPPPPQT